MINEDTFGFIDPNDVLRSSHIIPAFSQGQVHLANNRISHLAKDSNDWNRYYIMWCVSTCLQNGDPGLKFVLSFADRDMMMRYHWGLGVGHTYAHRKTTVPPNADGNNLDETHQDEDTIMNEEDNSDGRDSSISSGNHSD